MWGPNATPASAAPSPRPAGQVYPYTLAGSASLFPPGSEWYRPRSPNKRSKRQPSLDLRPVRPAEPERPSRGGMFEPASGTDPVIRSE